MIFSGFNKILYTFDNTIMITIKDLETLNEIKLPLPGADLVYPDYNGHGLVNIPSSICRWFGVPQIGAMPLANDYAKMAGRFDRVVVLVMDGLGWLSLQDYLRSFPREFNFWIELLEKDQLHPLTSISPSTTAAALTTLNTGKTPVEHGNLAYELWLKEYGVVANMILHAPMTFHGEAGSLKRASFKPEDFLPCITLDTHLISHGIRVQALHPYPIAQSSLTAMLFPEGRHHGYHSLGDLFYRIHDFMESKADTPAYLFAYWSEVDELSHLYSPADIRVRQALQDFTRYLSDLVNGFINKRGGPRTLLLITADHGQISTPHREEYDIKSKYDLVDCLTILPTGENRLPFLHVVPGQEERIRKLVELYWPGEFSLLKANDVLAHGLFGSGEVYKKTRSRLGDLVVFPRGSSYWWWANKETRLLGRHGGLSREEMIVPLGLVEV